MQLPTLLFLLALKLRVFALLSATFRKRLRNEDFALVIRTAVRDGRIRSRRGRDRSADTELVWCDPQTAVRIMLSSDELDSFSAIGKSQLRVVGNFENALRFMELAR